MQAVNEALGTIGRSLNDRPVGVTDNKNEIGEARVREEIRENTWKCINSIDGWV